MSVETVPKSMKQLRACLVCSLVKTFEQVRKNYKVSCHYSTQELIWGGVLSIPIVLVLYWEWDNV